MSLYERYGLVQSKSKNKVLPIEQEKLKQETLQSPFAFIDQPPSAVTGFTELQTLENYEPDRSAAFGYAAGVDNLIGSAANFLRSKVTWNDLVYTPDENFNVKDHEWGYEVVNREYWDELNASESVEEFQSKVKYFGKISKESMALDQLGLEGSAYRMAAFLGDVPLLNASLSIFEFLLT